MTRTGDWISTFSGRRVYPLDPRPDEIAVEDIAHALSLVCRFTGHVRELFTVGQHSLLVSLRCPPEHALWGLLHDASEAYLADVARPVKRDPRFGFYREAEHRMMAAICERFDSPMVEPSSVREADVRMLQTEKRDLLRPQPVWGEAQGSDVEPYDDVIVPRHPLEVEQAFLLRFEQLTRGHGPPAWCPGCGVPKRFVVEKRPLCDGCGFAKKVRGR